MKLKLTEIRRDDSAQPRAMLNTDHIKDLSDALEDGGDLTPVEVFHDGFSYWLADGFHRYSAYHRAKRDEIPVTVHQGQLRDAVLWSITANAKHAALKLTREEKRAGVVRLLKDEEWGQWSNREIARRAGVSEFLVRQMREADCDKSQSNGDCKTLQSDGDMGDSQVTRKGADGRTINTAKIGKPKADAPVVETPPSEPTSPPSDLSEYIRPRTMPTYSPPLTPETSEEDNLPEEVEEAAAEPYRPPYVRPQVPDIRVRQPDPSRRRPFERAFTAVGAINSLNEHIIVAALNSVENKTPQEGALELEITEAIKKLERCMASAEQERRTVTL